MADYSVTAFVTNLGKYNEGELIGEWVTFPIDEEEQAELFKRIGINDEYEEYFITDYDSELPLHDMFGEYVTLERLNEVADELDSLKDWEIETVLAMLDEGLFDDLMDAIENVDRYTLYRNIEPAEYEEMIIGDIYPEFFKAINDTWVGSYVKIDYDRMFRDDDYAYDTNYGILVEH